MRVKNEEFSYLIGLNKKHFLDTLSNILENCKDIDDNRKLLICFIIVIFLIKLHSILKAKKDDFSN